ncbi:MAG: type III secretion protein [Chlamydiales bacterium]|nr:type III secretion protein [Chlamydiia bacterium]MCP5507019.1 type III secretion protein [Chlamydiales bacterium]
MKIPQSFVRLNYLALIFSVFFSPLPIVSAAQDDGFSSIDWDNVSFDADSTFILPDHPTAKQPEEKQLPAAQTNTQPTAPVVKKRRRSPQQTVTNDWYDDTIAMESSANDKKLIAQDDNDADQPQPEQPETILINFNNVSIIEYIRFVSRITGKNFIFDEQFLDFYVTIVSEEPATHEDVMAALLQELRIHNLYLIEDGNNIVIHANSNQRAPGEVKASTLPETELKSADIVTQVFSLNTLDPSNIQSAILPILSDNAFVEVIADTNHLIVTDLGINVEKVKTIIKSVDAPISGMVIGQYVVRNAFLDTLVQNAELIMQPISQKQPITLVAHAPSNSIFVVSTPFLVERAIPLLQRLDQQDGTTSIYNLNDLQFRSPEEFEEQFGEEGKTLPTGNRHGRWKLDRSGNWYFDPMGGTGPDGKNLFTNPAQPPEGRWQPDAQGNWEFIPGDTPPEGLIPGKNMPKGRWILGPDGKWRFTLDQGESFFAGKKVRGVTSSNLPLGHIERTKFFIHKLQYRKGEGIEKAMLKIGESLRDTEAVNGELISAINSIQWLEESNSLVFTGTPEALLKVKELVEEIDQPLRQVFIEMLILEVDIDDSLEYGVNIGSRFGGGDTAGAQAFFSGASPLNSSLATSGLEVNNDGSLNIFAPDATGLTQNTGYHMGIIGQSINVCGATFKTLGALIKAVHDKTSTNIVMNPKIITEDNVAAEIFVGINTQFKTQSISNDMGSVLTNNYEFRDVGTTLKVTPLLGPTNIITLQIDQEVSRVATGTTQGTGAGTVSDQLSGPTTSINRTRTQVHVPDGYFIVISGMIQDEVIRTRSHVPCLGGAPIIGAAFTDKRYIDQKRNLLIFIRPQLVDTEEQIQNLTKHQQNIWKIKNRTKRMWKLDCDEAYEWMNLKTTNPLDMESSCECP